MYSKVSSSKRETKQTRKAAILRFLSGCSSEELSIFFNMAFSHLMDSIQGLYILRKRRMYIIIWGLILPSGHPSTCHSRVGYWGDRMLIRDSNVKNNEPTSCKALNQYVICCCLSRNVLMIRSTYLGIIIINKLLSSYLIIHTSQKIRTCVVWFLLNGKYMTTRFFLIYEDGG